MHCRHRIAELPRPRQGHDRALLHTLGHSMIGVAETTPFRTIEQLQCNGLTFPVMRWGRAAGRPVLLLHGFPQEPSTWSPIAEVLAEEGFEVFAPVQRGYTASARPQVPGGYTFAQFAGDALAIADAFCLQTFDVVGFGMGGVQAWMLAAYQPTRIRSLTSLRYPHPAAFAQGVQFEPQQRAKWQHLQQALGAADVHARADAMLDDDAAALRRFLANSGLPQPFLDRYVARLQEPGALVGAFSWERAIRLQEFAEVPTVTVPTLLIWSEGPALAPATVDATRNYVNASFDAVLIPNAGNFILETSPEALLAPLRKHLKST